VDTDADLSPLDRPPHSLAACEAHVAKDTWRRDGTTDWHGPYLTHLAANGYTLAEVEEYAANQIV
jgi:hypothetical protein